MQGFGGENWGKENVKDLNVCGKITLK